jgi:hypothetical protein
MHKVLQISDIHLNGEYNGKFDVKGHFERILKATRLETFSAVALTGDLADNGYYDDYNYIFTRIIETFGEDTPILVIPGNHDNRENLDNAYIDYINMSYKFKYGATLERMGGTFEEPGKCVVILGIPDEQLTSRTYYLVGMDNAHKDLPHAGLETLRTMKWRNQDTVNYAYMFVHMPLLRPFHRFMNGDAYSIPEDAAKTFLIAADSILNGFRVHCGHYHCASVDRYGDFVQYAAPASQCQLDPFSDTCVPSGNYPGYSIITLDKPGTEVKYILEGTDGN